MSTRTLYASFVLLLLVFLAPRPGQIAARQSGASPVPRADKSAAIADFRDIATSAGLTGRTVIGGEHTKDYILETTGGGVGRKSIHEVRSGGSFCSQNDLRLHFGVGAETRVSRIEVSWPAAPWKRFPTLRPISSSSFGRGVESFDGSRSSDGRSGVVVNDGSGVQALNLEPEP